MAFTGALGHHVCGKLMRRYREPRRDRLRRRGRGGRRGGCSARSGNVWMMSAASVLLGIGIGAAMTASYSAAGAVIPPGAHGAGFGVLTSASLVGMASSPFIAGFVGGTSIRVVFFVDLALMASSQLRAKTMATSRTADENSDHEARTTKTTKKSFLQDGFFVIFVIRDFVVPVAFIVRVRWKMRRVFVDPDAPQRDAIRKRRSGFSTAAWSRFRPTRSTGWRPIRFRAMPWRACSR